MARSERLGLSSLLGAVGLSIACAANAGPRSEMVRVAPDVQLHVLEDGKASTRPTLVLIPGWRLTASIWTDQIRLFAADRRVLAIDPRSQGDSTKTDEGDTPEQRARDYRALLSSVHAESVVLVGWSQGVQDVAAYVDQFGTDGIKAIVLVDSTISKGAANIPAHLPSAVQRFRSLSILSDSPRDYTEGMMHAIISKPLSEAAFNGLVAEALKTPTATSAAMFIADLYGKDRSAAIGKFTVPTLVIASGSSDELSEQKELASRLPNGRIEVVDQAAHAVFVDQPERFYRLVRDFLEHLPA
jgi:pimeloyl-ACP methyl ester carboxylesterase